MRISDVIEELKTILEQHGDLEVGDSDGNRIDTVNLMCGTSSEYAEVGTFNYCNLFDRSYNIADDEDDE